MVRPMRLCPWARSMAATVDESTPPDMATGMVCAGTEWLLAISSWRLALAVLTHPVMLSQAKHACTFSPLNNLDPFPPDKPAYSLRADRFSIVNGGQLTQAGDGLRDEAERESHFI